jgi:hypothetical protein
MNRPVRTLTFALGAATLSVVGAAAHDWTVSNGSKWAVHRIFVSPCGSTTWGANRLPENDVLTPDSSRTIRDLDADCYDVKLVDEDGDVCVVRLYGGKDLALTTASLTNCENNAH